MRRTPHKFTLESLASYFRSEGCELLSKEYKGTRSCVEYITRCGHKHKIWVNNFLSGVGRYCPKCKKRKSRRKLTLDVVKEIFRQKGCHLLSPQFVDTYTPLEYVCQCGHKNKIPLYRFDRGQGLVCPKCSGSKKKTIKEVQDIFKENGCTLLSTSYKWNREKLEYIASCGHKHTIKASAFFEGEGRLCPKCQLIENGKSQIKYSESKQKEILSSKGCELIQAARTTNDKMLYVAKCGHENQMKIAYFLQGYGQVCPRCYLKNVSRGEKEIKKVFEEIGVDFIAQKRIKIGTNWPLRFDFYLPKEKIAVEYNGRQHYEFNPFFHSHRSSKKSYSLKDAMERDERKRKWCEENGVELLEIDGRKWNAATIDNGSLGAFIRGWCINRGIGNT